jgi:hypothetical protein
VSVMKAQAITEWIKQNPGHPYLKQPGASLAGSPSLVLVSTAIAIIFPAFCLIWFLVVKRKTDDLGWREPEPLV